MGKSQKNPGGYAGTAVESTKAAWADPLKWAQNTNKQGMDLLTGAPQSPGFDAAAQKTADSSKAAVGAQTQANRPDQSTDFSSSAWHQNPDGSWSQSSRLSGGLGDAAGNLMNQARGDLSAPMDWSQFGTMDDGSGARDQAINAAYGQATSRLNPQWDQNKQLEDSSLANQGLDPNSQAYRTAQQQFGQQKNDAYGSAMNSAIQQGTAAQQATFNQNLMRRQQMISEALKRRNLSTDDLQKLQGFLGQAGFQGAGAADPTNHLGAAIAGGNFEMDKWKTQQQILAELMKGGTELGKSVIGVAGKSPVPVPGAA